MDEGDVIPLLAFFVFTDGHLELDTVNNGNKIQFCSRKKKGSPNCIQTEVHYFYLLSLHCF